MNSPRPALLAISMTPDHVADDVAFDDETMMTSGICRSCADKSELPELRTRILDSFRKIWPDLQMSDFSERSETKQ